VYLTYKQTVSSLFRKSREHRKFHRLFLQVDPWGSRFVRARDASVFALSTWNICRDQILMVLGITGSSFVKTNEPINLLSYIQTIKIERLICFILLFILYFYFSYTTLFFNNVLLYIWYFEAIYFCRIVKNWWEIKTKIFASCLLYVANSFYFFRRRRCLMLSLENSGRCKHSAAVYFRTFYGIHVRMQYFFLIYIFNYITYVISKTSLLIKSKMQL